MKLLVLALILAAVATPVSAGPYQDDLTKCMVSHTDSSDQRALVRWIVLAFASSSAAQDVVKIDTSKVQEIQVGMATYTERLFLQDCLLEAREAFRYEGESAVVEGFKLISQVAGREAMMDPAVSGILNGYIDLVDEAKFDREIFGR